MSWKKITLTVAALLIALYHTSAVTTPTSSLIMWSPFATLPQSHSEVASQSDVSTLISSVLSQRPEVVLAFLYHQMDSTQFSQYMGSYAKEPNQYFPLLKASISQSQSVQLPYVESSHFPISEQLSSELSRNHAAGRFLVASSGECDSVMQALRSETSDIARNGVTDVIVIKMNTEQTTAAINAQDQCYGSVLQMAKELTHNKFIAILSSDITAVTPLSSHGLTVLTETASTTTAAVPIIVPPTGIKYITSSILFALIFGGMFIFALYNGLACMMSIQTPLRFPGKKMPINKEFN